MTPAARAVGRIKRLCCLGLGSEIVIPAALRELHGVIPSYANQFMWTDANLQLSNIYSENPDTDGIASIYLERFYNRADDDVGRFSDLMRDQHGVMNLERALMVDRHSFYQRDLYNEIFRPFRYEDFLRLIVRQDGRALGALCVFRDPKSPPFTPADARALASLEPFFAHAFTSRSDLEAPLVDNGESGLIIANHEGRPVHFSPQAWRLLFLATHPQFAPGKSARVIALPPALVRICRNLSAVFDDDDTAPVPVHQHRNTWGGFTFRAYRLEGVDDPSRLVGIAISRQEPLPIVLSHKLDRLPLTSRQAEVCLLMASGLSYREIAERLDISRHTVIAHSRWIHDTLNVGNRTELVNRLMAT